MRQLTPAQQERAVSAAVFSMEMEGFELTEEMIAGFRRIARGEITADESIRLILARLKENG